MRNTTVQTKERCESDAYMLQYAHSCRLRVSADERQAINTLSAGSVLWQGAAETFVAAKVRIQKLALSSPGEYLILDQHTGQRVLVTPDVSKRGERGPSTRVREQALYAK